MRDKIIQQGCRLYESGYHRTKVREFLKGKTARKSIAINCKKERFTVTGVPINKNGRPILAPVRQVDLIGR